MWTITGAVVTPAGAVTRLRCDLGRGQDGICHALAEVALASISTAGLMRVSARRQTRSSICEGGREPGWVSPLALDRLKTLSTPHGTQLGGLSLGYCSTRIELGNCRIASDLDLRLIGLARPFPGETSVSNCCSVHPRAERFSSLSRDRASWEAQQS
jgi:hypothetical protein